MEDDLDSLNETFSSRELSGDSASGVYNQRSKIATVKSSTLSSTNNSNSVSSLALNITVEDKDRGDEEWNETSECSTICPTELDELESDSQLLLVKYCQKVRELVAESSNHLSDLNVLRRIFAHSLQEFVGYDSPLVSGLFGNINDVYECALRLV